MNSSTALRIALLFCLLIAACRSTDSTDNPAPAVSTVTPEQGPQAYDPRALQGGPPDALGAFLADLDKAMRAWTNLVLTAGTHADREKARQLEEVLQNRVGLRQQELIDELESGPPRNRAIAAGGLGFGDSKDVRGPLLVALADKHGEVVQNAALSLAVLQNAETPLEPLLEVFQGHANGQARANAGYAVRTILEAGAEPTEDTVKAARRALIDSEPFAQVQGCLILALAENGESVPHIAELLHSRSPLVIGAATQALVALGRNDPKLLGPTARALVTGLGTCPDEQRPYILKNLILLSGHNFADDDKAWVEWSLRLP